MGNRLLFEIRRNEKIYFEFHVLVVLHMNEHLLMTRRMVCDRNISEFLLWAKFVMICLLIIQFLMFRYCHQSIASETIEVSNK